MPAACGHHLSIAATAAAAAVVGAGDAAAVSTLLYTVVFLELRLFTIFAVQQRLAL